MAPSHTFRLLTLPCRSTPTGEPADTEYLSVNDALALARRLRKVGGARLMLARMNWERLFSSATPPGAATPTVAKASLTRDSRRRWELARKANRSGVTPAFRLAKAIMERKA